MWSYLVHASLWTLGAQGVDIPSKHPVSTCYVPVCAGPWGHTVTIPGIIQFTAYLGGRNELNNYNIVLPLRMGKGWHGLCRSAVRWRDQGSLPRGGDTDTSAAS